MWNSNAFAAQCGSPVQEPNAHLEATGQVVGDTVTYTCDECYNGGGNITCQGNGEWTAAPSCKSTTTNLIHTTHVCEFWVAHKYES